MDFKNALGIALLLLAVAWITTGCQTPFDACPRGFSVQGSTSFGDFGGYQYGSGTSVEGKDVELLQQAGKVRGDINTTNLGGALHFDFKDVRKCETWGGKE